MTRTACVLPFVALVFSTGCISSEAQTSPVRAPAADTLPAQNIQIPESIVRQIRQDPDDALKRQITQLYIFSEDGIVTREQVARYERMLQAQGRAQRLEKLLVFDLDADGQVTRSEIVDATFHDRRQDRVAIDIAMLKGDKDRNDILTITEMLAVVGSEAAGEKTLRPEANPMMFDRNLDGKVDPREVSDVIAQIATNLN